MGGLETLTPDRRDEAIAYLARAPYDNVYLSWLIATGQIARGETLVWRNDAGAIAGVCYLGSQIVAYADDDAAIDAFAQRSRRLREMRMIVGPRPGIERFWAQAREWMPAPSAIRASQPVYALETAETLAPFVTRDGDVARATRDELDEIWPESAIMTAGELGGEPSRYSYEFRNRTGRIIDAGWWWRYRVGGRLAFMCNVGSATARTAQIQGVWTPLGMRGSGHATVGLATICARLLDEHPTLTLYVNDFNVGAIALYERVGFVRVGEFQTILFL